MHFKLNFFNLFFFLLWIFGIISLILLLIYKKQINEWLHKNKKNKVEHFNMNDYYKLEVGEKKYYYLKSQLMSLKEMLRSEKIKLVVIEELHKLIILNDNETPGNIDEIIKELCEPKIKSLKFKSNIEMKEIIINI